MDAMRTDFPFPACPAPWGAELTGVLVLGATLAGLILMAAARFHGRG